MMPTPGDRTELGQGRHRPLLLAGAGVLAFVLGAGVVASRNGRTHVVMERPAGTPPVPVETAASASPERAVVTSSRQGAVWLVDTRSGKKLRTLATYRPQRDEDDPALLGVSMTPDGRFGYYSRSGGCGAGTLYRVRLDGRDKPAVVAKGIAPAVSPDGHYLAYAIPGRDRPEADACYNGLAVLDLVDNSIRQFWYPADEDHSGALYTESELTGIAWSPDSRRVAFTLSYEGDSMSVLDLDTMTDLGQATEVVVPGGGGDSRHPAWQPGSGLLGLVNQAFECCYDDIYEGPPRTLLADLTTQTVQDLLPPGFVPAWLDFDRTGEHLLYVDGEGGLWRRSRGLEATPVITTGVTAADWN